MNSIRRGLVRRMALAGAALSVVSAAVGYLAAKPLVERRFDGELERRIANLALRFEQEGERVEFDFDDAYLPEYLGREPVAYYQLWIKETGTHRSQSLGGLDLPRLLEPGVDEARADLALPDGRRGRILGRRLPVVVYEPGPGGADPGPLAVEIAVAIGRDRLDRALWVLLAGLGAGIAGLFGLGTWLGVRAIDRGLEPVGELARHVEGIRDPTQAQSFPPDQAPRELRPVVDGLNRLVRRGAELLSRERRTSANIAHELRTPVAELLALTDVALGFGAGEEDARRALGEAREVGLEMRRLVGILLHLSRVEAGAIELDAGPLRLEELFEHLVEASSERAAERSIRVVREGAGDLVADREATTILAGNLLVNAIEHAPEGSTVQCRIGRRADGVELRLDNPANGLRESDLALLTEPFWRADGARESNGHAGLGLALAERIAKLMGAELDLTLEAGRFVARVRFQDPA